MKQPTDDVLVIADRMLRKGHQPRGCSLVELGCKGEACSTRDCSIQALVRFELCTMEDGQDKRKAWRRTDPPETRWRAARYHT